MLLIEGRVERVKCGGREQPVWRKRRCSAAWSEDDDRFKNHKPRFLSSRVGDGLGSQYIAQLVSSPQVSRSRKSGSCAADV